MPAATGKRRRAEKAAAAAKSKPMPNAAAAAAVGAASASPSKKRASASAEPSRAEATPVDAASLDLDAFLNGGFLSVVPTPQGKGGIGLASGVDDQGEGDGLNNDRPKPRRSAASKHRAELEALKTKDPEFFEYLKQADAELLDFAGDDDDDEEDDEEEDEEGSDDDDDDDNDDASSLSGSSDGEEEPSTSSSSDDDDGEAALAPASPTAASADLPTTQKNKKTKRAVVPSQILRWCSEAKETLSLRAFKCLLQAYRAACHHGEGSTDVVGKKKKQKQKKKNKKHGGGSDSDDDEDSDFDDNSDADDDAAASAALASGAASNALLLFVLREADGIFRRLLGMPPADEKSGKKKVPAHHHDHHLDPRSSPKWKKVEPLARSYLGNSLHLLSSAADPAMEAFVLRRLRPSAFLLVCSERLQRKTMKAALAVFGADVSSSAPGGGNAATAAPLQAALFVREAAAALPSSSDAFEAALKGAYRAFVRAAKFVTPASAPRLALMSACVVDLYASAPAAAAYAAAFGYVRQLAQLVRGALDAKAKEGYRTVYCWQTVSCLELWARLLAALLRAAGSGGGANAGANGDDDDSDNDGDGNNHALEPLVFPVIQLLLTSASLVPSLRYAPLHLRLLKAASDLGAASGRFVPVAPPLLDLLDNVAAAAEATAARGGGGNRKGGGGKTPGGGGGAPQRHSSSSSSDAFLLRASKVSVASATWQADIAERACEALASASAAAPWPTHPAFPELAAPTIARLRAFSKSCGGRGGTSWRTRCPCCCRRRCL